MELTCEQDPDKARGLETWLDPWSHRFNILPMDGPVFRQWACLMHRQGRQPLRGRHDRGDRHGVSACISSLWRRATPGLARTSRWSCSILLRLGPTCPVKGNHLTDRATATKGTVAARQRSSRSRSDWVHHTGAIAAHQQQRSLPPAIIHPLRFIRRGVGGAALIRNGHRAEIDRVTAIGARIADAVIPGS